jgi:hypothetical protein
MFARLSRDRSSAFEPEMLEPFHGVAFARYSEPWSAVHLTKARLGQQSKSSTSPFASRGDWLGHAVPNQCPQKRASPPDEAIKPRLD